MSRHDGAQRMSNSKILVAACGLLLSTPALAQDSESPGAVREIPPLQGPTVDDERAPGTDSRFSMGMERARESERPIPLRIYDRELRAISGVKAPAGVRLSEEQRKTIRGFINEHQRALRSFYRAHQQEIDAIRAADKAQSDTKDADQRGLTGLGARRERDQDKGPESRPGNDRQGDRPATGSGNGPETDRRPSDRQPGAQRGGAWESMSPEARKKMQEIRKQGPQDSAVITRVWGVLTDVQRDHLEGRFEQIRAEEMRAREMRKAEQRTSQRTSDRAPGDAPVTDRLPERLRQRLEGMTPEEREAALKRWRDRRGSAGADKPAGAPKRDD